MAHDMAERGENKENKNLTNGKLGASISLCSNVMISFMC